MKGRKDPYSASKSMFRSPVSLYSGHPVSQNCSVLVGLSQEFLIDYALFVHEYLINFVANVSLPVDPIVYRFQGARFVKEAGGGWRHGRGG